MRSCARRSPKSAFVSTTYDKPSLCLKLTGWIRTAKIGETGYINHNCAVSSEHLAYGFPTRTDINRAVRPQQMARGLQFRVKEVETLYYEYLRSENKGADQLRGLCLVFRI